MEETTEPRRRLLVSRTLLDAAEALWLHREPLLRATVIPLVVLTLLSTLGGSLLVLPVLLVFKHAAYAVFAVSCHRVLLLGPDALPNPWGVYFTARELRYAAFSLILVVTGGAAMFVVAWAAPVVLGVFGTAAFWLLYLCALACGVYLFARLCVILPGLAIDQKWSLPASWWLTSQNGLRLSALVFAGYLPTLLGGAIVMVFRVDYLGLSWALQFAAYLAQVFGIAVVSMAFWSLCPARLLPGAEPAAHD